MHSVLLSELCARGVALEPCEAVAIAQLLIDRADTSAEVARPPFGPPTAETVELGCDGSVVCTRDASTPTVAEIAILLQSIAPARMPGGLRYTIGRALLEVDAPPFDSIEEFSRALARYERGDRADVVRRLLERADAARDAAPAVWCEPGVEPRRAGEGAGNRSLGAAAVPTPSPSLALTIVRPLPSDDRRPWPVERRRAGARIDELRRQLRDVDRQRYEEMVAPSVLPSAAGSRAWRAPMIAGGALAAAIAGIAAFQVVGLRLIPRSTTLPTAALHQALDLIAPRSASADTSSTVAPAPSAIRSSSSLVHQTPVVAPIDETGTPIFDRELRVIRIVSDTARNYHVRPSPDGRLIAFDSDRDGPRAVYVANRDGSQVRRVSGNGDAAMPAWSSDSRRLMFARAETNDPSVWNLWVLTLEGGEMRRLTEYHTGQTWSASWFPEAEQICYTHGDRLIVRDLGGDRSREFVSPVKHAAVHAPVVSPDGRRIVFQVSRHGAWLLDLSDGSMQCALTDPTAADFAWAPDARRVAYHSQRDGHWGIYVLRPQTPIATTQDARDIQPDRH